MASNLKICIQNIQTNLYKWFEFPESEQTIRKSLGISDHDEYLIVDWDDFNSIINEYTSIRSLNRFAEKLQEIPDNIQPYFDYEVYGRDARLELNCVNSDQYYAWQ